MLTLNLPSCGIRIKFDKMWSVTPLKEGGDEILFQEGEYPNKWVATFITFFPSMWNVACTLATKVNPKLQPDGPYAFPFTFPDGLSWSGMYANVPATRPYGRTLSYADGYNEWTEDGIWSLFEHLVGMAEECEAATWILGAAHHKFEVDKYCYLQATKTKHCVRFNYTTLKWEVYAGEPEGIPSVSSVGITSYINEGISGLPMPQLIIGVNMLVSCVGIDYSTDLLQDVPEELFQDTPYSTELEQALPLTTNPNRLFYLLNTERDAMKPEEVAEDFDKPEVPTITWQERPIDGVPFETGGAALVEGGNGDFELYEVVRWLSDAYEAYGNFACGFDCSHLSELAIKQFEEKFGAVRVDVSPSKPSTTMPIQLEVGPITYAWDDARWYPILGSQKPNPEVYDSFRYINMKVSMSTALWANLLKVLIDQFYGPVPGLAALYYNTVELPDEVSAYDGIIRIIDHWRMQEACFSKGSWFIQEASPYTSEALLTETGLAVEVSGAGSVSSKDLAHIVLGACEQSLTLLENRFAEIDELCKDTAFGTYALLHECMPVALLDLHSAPMTGVVRHVVSPIVLYKDKQRLSNTPNGWTFHNLNPDRAKKVGTVGAYTIAHDTGAFPWDGGVAQVIKDTLELVLDLDNPAVVAAIELEHAQ